MCTMVHSAGKDEPERPPSMDTVPRLPKIACAQPYSANPYEIDLSFRNVDLMAMEEQRRKLKRVVANILPGCSKC